MAVGSTGLCNRPTAAVVVGNVDGSSQALAYTFDYAGLVVVVVVVGGCKSGGSWASCCCQLRRLLYYYYYFDSTSC